MTFSIDDFLGGQVRLKQYQKGLRATSDSVLLASAVQAKANETILDVGTGNGVIVSCLNARIKHLNLTALDYQEDLLKLTQENAVLNNFNLETIEADIQNRPSPIHGRQFHHVVTNPPFYTEPFKRMDKQTAKAYQQQISVREWLEFCLRHIRAKGTLTLIHRPESLPVILSVLNGKLGGIEIIPIAGKAKEPAKRIIIRGRMNSRKPLTIHPTLVLTTLQNKQTNLAEAIFRKGKSLDNFLKTT